ncbi:sensor histidine kinase [Streptomyces vinaceus]|uniref:sensor histidine kinase n=1 Tax=Streptomyces vinaceus TaxID=1960 RepID=UPI0036CD3AA8
MLRSLGGAEERGEERERPRTVPAAPGAEAVAAIQRDFERHAQRMRSSFRLVLVAVMALVAWGGAAAGAGSAQFVLVGVYGVLALAAWWLVRHPPAGARGLRPSVPLTAVVIDVAAVTALQFLSVGSYLSLGLLAFLPFLTASQPGRQPLILSLAALLAGGSVLTDPAFREQMNTVEAVAVLAMLALLCAAAVAVARVQQRRLAKVVALTVSRSVLLQEVVSAEARERRAVAESVHDGPLQTILAARQDLEQSWETDGDGLPFVKRAFGLLGDVSQDLREVSVALHPDVVEETGLVAAVELLARTTGERAALKVTCEVDHPRRHPADTALFGVARELLSNVARHAEADHVRVALRDTGPEVILEVQDDGVGTDPDVMAGRLAEGHIGLVSQRARVEALGGRMELLPAERGTWVRVTVPVTEQSPDGSHTP